MSIFFEQIEYIIIIWIVSSLMIAIIGSKREIGFWISLIISIILSPLVGLIVALTSKSTSGATHSRWQEYKLMAEQEVKRKNIKKAVSYYRDALDKLESDYMPEKTPDGLRGKARNEYHTIVKAAEKLIEENKDLIPEAEEKLENLKDKQAAFNE